MRRPCRLTTTVRPRDSAREARRLRMERLAGRIILLWGWRRAVAGASWPGAGGAGAGALRLLRRLLRLLPGPGLAARRRHRPTPRPGFLRRLRPAFAVGWWFGFGYFLAGLWWIGSALLVEAESFAWALPLRRCRHPAVLAFFYGFATARRAALLEQTTSAASRRSPSASALAEWLRGFLFTGFPWNADRLCARCRCRC